MDESTRHTTASLSQGDLGGNPFPHLEPPNCNGRSDPEILSSIPSTQLLRFSEGQNQLHCLYLLLFPAAFRKREPQIQNPKGKAVSASFPTIHCS